MKTNNINIEISAKLYRKFQTFEECEGMSEIEVQEYFTEIAEELLEDYILQRLNKQQDNEPQDDPDDE